MSIPNVDFHHGLLAQRLEKGPVQLDQALQVAIEIADALDKAHRQGIVHRDLKPGNIMLTKAGAKLLDFGLAKLRTSGPVGVSAPTMSAGLTGEGAILGTLQYMAPEQLEGKEADHRTDIFAFGAMVYEMVTGQRAFEGESQASLIAAILEHEPVPMATLQTLAPARLDEIVTTCLAKDPEERWQSVADIGRQLWGIGDDRTLTQVSADEAAVSEAPRWRLGVSLVVGGMLAGGLIVWTGVWSPLPQVQPVERFTIDAPPDGPVSTEQNSQLAIAPDGSRIAWGSYTSGDRNRVYLRELDQLEGTRFNSISQGGSPFFSPDGQQMGFVDGASLKRVAVLGGPVETIAELPGVTMRDHLGASWGPDDTIVFATTTSGGLMQVSAAGGTPEQLTVAPGDAGVHHAWPEVLPDGRGVLFTEWSGTVESSRIVAMSLTTREVTPLVPGGTSPRYAASGHIVYGAEDGLRAVGFDQDGLRLTTEPLSVIDDVNIKVSGAVDFSLSDSGSLVYLPRATALSTLEFVWVDRDGVATPVPIEPGRYQEFRISPDGSGIAVRVSARDRDDDLWLYDLASGAGTRLTFSSLSEYFPTWTPDGQHVAFGAAGAPIAWTTTDGTLEVEPLDAGSPDRHPVVISPDGETLVYRENGSNGRPGDLGVLSLQGARESEILWRTPHREANADLSPDGQWIAYGSNESGRSEIIVRRFQDVDASYWQISEDGGWWPMWKPSLEGPLELFFVGRPGMMAVTIETEPVFSYSSPQLLFESEGYRLSWGGNRRADVSPDGTRFLMFKDTDQRPDPILLQNWFDELQRLVPSP